MEVPAIDARETIPHSEFRIPHLSIPPSAIRNHCSPNRSLSDDGAVTQAVTHTPHPTHPSALITGWPAASIASARSPTGHARAHTPQDAP